MSDRTTVGERGQTAIPARLRRQAKIKAGTELEWESVGPDEWRVHVVRDGPQRADPLAMLGFAKRFRKTKRTSAWMAELRRGEK